MIRLALTFARDWQRTLIEIQDREKREAQFKAAIRLERRDSLHSMLALARNLHPITDAGERWDADPWLMGVSNGVVDLRTGRLRPGRRDDHITMSTAVPFDPDGLFRRQDGLYTLTFPALDTEFHVDRLRWERDELHGQLSVACGLAGALTVDGWLSGLGSFNLSSPTGRKQRATVIADRARAKGADWGGMLEELCLRVLKAERAGSSCSAPA